MKVPEKFLTEESMKRMEGLTVTDFMNYPENDRSDETETAVKKVFGGDGADVLKQMKTKKGDVQKSG